MKKKLSIDAGAYFTISLFLLLLGPKWIGAILFAASIHELGHLAALWLYDCRVYRIRIIPFGARIETEPLHGKAGCVCALAGPFAGGLVMLFYPWFPKAAFCAMVQTLFNLLPIYPLDGGRAVKYWINEKAVAKSIDSGYNNWD